MKHDPVTPVWSGHTWTSTNRPRRTESCIDRERAWLTTDRGHEQRVRAAVATGETSATGPSARESVSEAAAGGPEMNADESPIISIGQ